LVVEREASKGFTSLDQFIESAQEELLILNAGISVESSLGATVCVLFVMIH